MCPFVRPEIVDNDLQGGEFITQTLKVWVETGKPTFSAKMIMVFGKLFGFLGVLLSVPLAAIAKILGNEFVMPLIRGFADEDPKAPAADSS